MNKDDFKFNKRVKCPVCGKNYISELSGNYLGNANKGIYINSKIDTCPYCGSRNEIISKISSEVFVPGNLIR